MYSGFAVGPALTASAGEVYSTNGFTEAMLRQASGPLTGAGTWPESSIAASGPSGARPCGVEDRLLAQQDESESEGPATGRNGRKPQMQGRFSGRLALKEDEKRLVEECKLLGPLLGGVGKRTDKSRLTLAKIVRGIACGAVRRYCEEREAMLETFRVRAKELESMIPTFERLQEQVLMMRAELDVKDKRLAELEPDLPNLARAVRQAVQHQLALKHAGADPSSTMTSLSASPFLAGSGGGGGLATRYSIPQPYDQPQQPLALPAPMSAVPPPMLGDTSIPGMAAINAHQAAIAAMGVKRRSSTGVGSGPVPVDVLPDGNLSGAGMGAGQLGPSPFNNTVMAGISGGVASLGQQPVPPPVASGTLMGDNMRLSGTGSALPIPVPPPTTLVMPPAVTAPARTSTAASLQPARSLGTGSALPVPQPVPAPSGSQPGAASAVQLGNNGSLPLQSPFCIPIPSSTAANNGNGAGLNMEALLAQHNAQVASAGSQQLSAMQATASQNGASITTGYPGSTASGSVAASRMQSQEVLRPASRALPFPDMARAPTMGSELQPGGSISNFAALKAAGIQKAGPPDLLTTWPAAANGPQTSNASAFAAAAALGLPDAATETVRRTSGSDPVSVQGGAGVASSAVGTALGQEDTVAGNMLTQGDAVVQIGIRDVVPGHDSPMPGMQGSLGKRGPLQEDAAAGVQNSAKRNCMCGSNGDGTGAHTACMGTPPGSAEALNLLSDAGLVPAEDLTPRQAQVVEEFGQHASPRAPGGMIDVPPPTLSASPQLLSHDGLQQQHQPAGGQLPVGLDALASAPTLSHQTDLLPPLPASTQRSPLLDTTQAAAASAASLDASQQAAQSWAGHFSLSAQQQQLEAMQGQMLPVPPSTAPGSAGTQGLSSLTSTPSWLGQLPQSSTAATAQSQPQPLQSSPVPTAANPMLQGMVGASAAAVRNAQQMEMLQAQMQQEQAQKQQMEMLQAQMQAKQQQQQQAELLAVQQQQMNMLAHAHAQQQQQLDMMHAQAQAQAQQQQQQLDMMHAQAQAQAQQQQQQQQQQQLAAMQAQQQARAKLQQEQQWLQQQQAAAAAAAAAQMQAPGPSLGLQQPFAAMQAQLPGTGTDQSMVNSLTRALSTEPLPFPVKPGAAMFTPSLPARTSVPHDLSGGIMPAPGSGTPFGALDPLAALPMQQTQQPQPQQQQQLDLMHASLGGMPAQPLSVQQQQQQQLDAMNAQLSAMPHQLGAMGQAGVPGLPSVFEQKKRQSIADVLQQQQLDAMAAAQVATSAQQQQQQRTLVDALDQQQRLPQAYPAVERRPVVETSTALPGLPVAPQQHRQSYADMQQLQMVPPQTVQTHPDPLASQAAPQTPLSSLADVFDQPSLPFPGEQRPLMDTMTGVASMPQSNPMAARFAAEIVEQQRRQSIADLQQAQQQQMDAQAQRYADAMEIQRRQSIADMQAQQQLQLQQQAQQQQMDLLQAQAQAQAQQQQQQQQQQQVMMMEAQSAAQNLGQRYVEAMERQRRQSFADLQQQQEAQAAGQRYAEAMEQQRRQSIADFQQAQQQAQQMEAAAAVAAASASTMPGSTALNRYDTPLLPTAPMPSGAAMHASPTTGLLVPPASASPALFFTMPSS